MHLEAAHIRGESSPPVTQTDIYKPLLYNLIFPVPVVPYIPQKRELPTRVLRVPTAWNGIESIIRDLIDTFNVRTHTCLEFGVEFGYSTAALSCFFDQVIGVDQFTGDEHTANRGDIFRKTSQRLSRFPNIRLVRSDYRDWIERDENFYDLIHVDIVHTYADTFNCGLWAARRATCVLFHDTVSFPVVRWAVSAIARVTEKRFFNFKESHGLGILV